MPIFEYGKPIKINTRDESLREILSNGKEYFVPKFQRDYSWENKQLENLWQNTQQMEDDDHYMGYLVIQEQDKNAFKIVDGQQRLTTFSLMVLSAIKRRILLISATLWLKKQSLPANSCGF